MLRLKVVQLTSLRPAADQFCGLLSLALRAELKAGKMKTVKPFARTCYSENLVLESSPVADKEREDGSLIDGGGKAGEGDAPSFHGGLGLKFKFPGDPKKYVSCPLLSIELTLLGFERRPRRSYGRTISGVGYSSASIYDLRDP